MLEERKNVLHGLIEGEGGRKRAAMSASMVERAKETQTHIDRIRAMLMASTEPGRKKAR
jgi:hypothetical protein